MSNGNSTTHNTVRQIPLTQGKVALIDEGDFDRVSQYKWHARLDRNVWYAKRNTPRPNRTSVFLHRFILDAPPDKQVDHVNGDGLDNRRCNLRLCTNAENMRNSRKRHGSSRFKGVTWNRECRKWRASIHVDYRTESLGYFNSEEDAHAAYCEASRKYHGDFGRTS